MSKRDCYMTKEEEEAELKEWLNSVNDAEEKGDLFLENDEIYIKKMRKVKSC